MKRRVNKEYKHCIKLERLNALYLRHVTGTQSSGSLRSPRMLSLAHALWISLIAVEMKYTMLYFLDYQQLQGLFGSVEILAKKRKT